MQFDLSNYKITVGSINVSPREDPINGPNGTAVVTRFNTFVEGVQTLFNQTLPTNRGGLITADVTGKVTEQALGASNFCLVASPTSNTGLVWEPRVDLTSNQTIAGLKVFTQMTVLNGFISKEESQVQADLLVDGLLAADRVRVAKDLEVLGVTNLQSNLNVAGNTSIKGRLDVTQLATFQDAAIISRALTVGGATNLGSTLTVTSGTALQSTLSVAGLSSINSLEASGYIAARGEVAGTDLKATANLSVGGKATINDLVAASLSVSGNSQFASLSVGSLTCSGLFTAGQGANIAGDIVATGDLRSRSATFQGDISTSGKLTAVKATLSELELTGRMTLSGGLQVTNGITTDSLIASGSISTQAAIDSATANISGALTSGSLSTGSFNARGDALLEKGLLVMGASELKGAVVASSSLQVGGNETVAGSLEVKGNITSTSLQSASITASNAIATSLSSGSLQVDGNSILSGETLADNITCRDLTVEGLALVSNLQVEGTFTLSNPLSMPGLSGENTGDELPATASEMGIVQLDSPSDPVVYSKQSADSKFLSYGDPRIAFLDGNNWIPEVHLPPKAFTKPFVVPSLSSQLSLNAQEGDIAIRSDEGKAYILSSGGADNLSNWLPLTFEVPANIISSVFGRVGPVIAQEGDYSASQIGYSHISYPLAKNVQTILGEVINDLASHKSNTDNPHNLTLEMLDGIPLSLLGQPQGVAPLDSEGFIPKALLRSNRLESVFDASNLVGGKLTLNHQLGAVPVVQVLDRDMTVRYVPMTLSNQMVVIDLNSLLPLPGQWKVILIV